ncbi:MAG TPA: hypothetical protein VKG45_08560 [Actinomycetes bacterium]|nr:hypothetical protein [Actinomycetes bacterium]
MRLFSNLPLILLLIALWPVFLLGVLMACSALERRTLVPKAPGPRRRRRRRAAPERIEAMVLEETAMLFARYWSSTGMSPHGGVRAAERNGGLPITRPAPGPRHPTAP